MSVSRLSVGYPHREGLTVVVIVMVTARIHEGVGLGCFGLNYAESATTTSSRLGRRHQSLLTLCQQLIIPLKEDTVGSEPCLPLIPLCAFVVS